jgi:hypothetical protein
MRHIRRLVIAASATVLALALCGGASAEAATLSVEHSCYFRTASTGQRINFTGSGFTPNANTLQVRFGGRVLTGRVGAGGTFAGFFTAPSLRFRQQRLTLSASDGVNNATTTVAVTKVFGDFSPSSGRPETLTAHILVQGLGAALDALQRNSRGTVYAHYIRPNGKLKANRRLGSLSGACGSLRTGKIRLLPYRSELGAWRVYLDTNPTYKKHEVARVLIGFTVRLVSRHR